MSAAKPILRFIKAVFPTSRVQHESPGVDPGNVGSHEHRPVFMGPGFRVTRSRLHRKRTDIEALSGKTAQTKQSGLRSVGAYLTKFELSA